MKIPLYEGIDKAFSEKKGSDDLILTARFIPEGNEGFSAELYDKLVSGFPHVPPEWTCRQNSSRQQYLSDALEDLNLKLLGNRKPGKHSPVCKPRVKEMIGLPLKRETSFYLKARLYGNGVRTCVIDQEDIFSVPMIDKEVLATSRDNFSEAFFYLNQIELNHQSLKEIRIARGALELMKLLS